MVNRKVPRIMSTQHPDNVTIPFFSESPILRGDDEVKEAYYVFSHLGCDEQMWDYEGKDADAYVVRKLLYRYPQFFRDNILGKDVFLTFRVPNPSIEKNEAKITLEVLESIPRNYDYIKFFYSSDPSSVFEVILPMVSNSQELEMLHQYYSEFVVGKSKKKVGDTIIENWVGEFKPEKINVIPLFEDKKYLINCDKILKEFVENKDFEYLRVFLAKSDLSMNYGGFSSDVYLRIALYNLRCMEEETGIKIYPIVGFGSPPFRGNLRPENAELIAKKWRSVFTFTIQSAFKYDNPEKNVMKAIKKIKYVKPSINKIIDEEDNKSLAELASQAYRKSVVMLSKIVNALSVYVPRRRERKLHIGLFGYSREVNGVYLPRAIPFCCALYSLGIPPELAGLGLLEDKVLCEIVNLYKDEIEFALKFFNKNVCKKLGFEKIYPLKLEQYGFEVSNFKLAEEIYDAFRKNRLNILSEKILESARFRRFLG